MVSYFSAVERCSEVGSVVYNNDTKGQTCDNQGLLCKRKGFWTSIHRYENLRYPSVHGMRYRLMGTVFIILFGVTLSYSVWLKLVNVCLYFRFQPC